MEKWLIQGTSSAIKCSRSYVSVLMPREGYVVTTELCSTNGRWDKKYLYNDQRNRVNPYLNAAFVLACSFVHPLHTVSGIQLPKKRFIGYLGCNPTQDIQLAVTGIWNFTRVSAITCLLLAKDTTGSLTSTSKCQWTDSLTQRPSEGWHTHWWIALPVKHQDDSLELRRDSNRG